MCFYLSCKETQLRKVIVTLSDLRYPIKGSRNAIVLSRGYTKMNENVTFLHTIHTYTHTHTHTHIIGDNL